MSDPRSPEAAEIRLSPGLTFLPGVTEVRTALVQILSGAVGGITTPQANAFIRAADTSPPQTPLFDGAYHTILVSSAEFENSNSFTYDAATGRETPAFAQTTGGVVYGKATFNVGGPMLSVWLRIIARNPADLAQFVVLAENKLGTAGSVGAFPISVFNIVRLVAGWPLELQILWSAAGPAAEAAAPPSSLPITIQQADFAGQTARGEKGDAGQNGTGGINYPVRAGEFNVVDTRIPHFDVTRYGASPDNIDNTAQFQYATDAAYAYWQTVSAALAAPWVYVTIPWSPKPYMFTYYWQPRDHVRYLGVGGMPALRSDIAQFGSGGYGKFINIGGYDGEVDPENRMYGGLYDLVGTLTQDQCVITVPNTNWTFNIGDIVVLMSDEFGSTAGGGRTFNFPVSMRFDEVIDKPTPTTLRLKYGIDIVTDNVGVPLTFRIAPATGNGALDIWGDPRSCWAYGGFKNVSINSATYGGWGGSGGTFECDFDDCEINAPRGVAFMNTLQHTRYRNITGTYKSIAWEVSLCSYKCQGENIRLRYDPTMDSGFGAPPSYHWSMGEQGKENGVDGFEFYAPEWTTGGAFGYFCGGIAGVGQYMKNGVVRVGTIVGGAGAASIVAGTDDGQPTNPADSTDHYLRTRDCKYEGIDVYCNGNVGGFITQGSPVSRHLEGCEINHCRYFNLTMPSSHYALELDSSVGLAVNDFYAPRGNLVFGSSGPECHGAKLRSIVLDTGTVIGTPDEGDAQPLQNHQASECLVWYAPEQRAIMAAASKRYFPDGAERNPNIGGLNADSIVWEIDLTGLVYSRGGTRPETIVLDYELRRGTGGNMRTQMIFVVGGVETVVATFGAIGLFTVLGHVEVKLLSATAATLSWVEYPIGGGPPRTLAGDIGALGDWQASSDFLLRLKCYPDTLTAGTYFMSGARSKVLTEGYNT